MKFRNKKTGKVFDNIVSAWVGFKCPGPCGDCNLQRGSTCKREWIQTHPYKAAELMGYEVIENSKGDIKIDKPRICDILGIDVGEKVRYKRNDTQNVFIEILDNKGNLRFSYEDGTPLKCDEMLFALLGAINYPNHVYKLHFTEQEIERAKNLLEVVGDCELNQVGDMTSLKADGKIIYLRKGAFPSLKPEQAINLSQIISIGS